MIAVRPLKYPRILLAENKLDVYSLFVCHSEGAWNSGPKPLRTICSEMLPGTTAIEPGI